MSFNTSANSSLESFSGKRLSRILKIARSPSAHWYTERSRCSTASSALLVNKVKTKASVGLRWKVIQRQELGSNPQFPSFVVFSIFIRTAKVAQTSTQFRSRSRRRGILRGHRQVLCSWALLSSEASLTRRSESGSATNIDSEPGMRLPRLLQLLLPRSLRSTPMRFHRVGIASKVSYEVLDSLESGWLCAAAGHNKWENDTRGVRQVLWHQQLYIYIYI